jgi:hypothetical protein
MNSTHRTTLSSGLLRLSDFSGALAIVVLCAAVICGTAGQILGAVGVDIIQFALWLGYPAGLAGTAWFAFLLLGALTAPGALRRSR